MVVKISEKDIKQAREKINKIRQDNIKQEKNKKFFDKFRDRVSWRMKNG